MKSEKGVSTAVVAVAVVAVLLVAGLAYYFASPPGHGTSESSTATSSSQSTATTSNTANSSSASQSRSVSNSTNSGCTGNGTLILSFADPNPPLAAADVVVNYTLTLTALGAVPGSMTLTASGPPGFSLGFSPSQVSTSSQSQLTLSVGISKGTAAGDFPIDIRATGEGQCYSSKATIQVVHYLVVTVGDQYVPANLTVPSGSTVTWLRLNGAISQYDSGTHNIRFTNPDVMSPTLQQYGSWGYSFPTAGSFPYYCTFHPGMTGDITVSP